MKKNFGIPKKFGTDVGTEPKQKTEKRSEQKNNHLPRPGPAMPKSTRPLQVTMENSNGDKDYCW